jgi:hypothetical protein
MPFIAECLFCGHQLRAPDDAAGMSATCPKCGNSFTLAAMARGSSRGPLGLNLKAPKKLDAPLSEMKVPPTPKVLATPAQTTSISKPPPEVYVNPALKTQQLPPLVSVPGPPTSPPPDAWLHPFGVGSFFLGSIALLWPQFGFLQFLAIPLSIAGLFLGLLGIVVYLEAPKKRLLLPGIGATVSGAVLLVVLFWPDVLDPNYRRYGAVADVTPSGSDEWVDVSRNPVSAGDVRLYVTRAFIQEVELKNTQGKTTGRKKYLRLNVRLSNAGGARKINYESWNAPGHTGVLSDNKDHVYPVPALPAGTQVPGQVHSASLLPGKFATDVLLFEPPGEQITYLRLELPASALRGRGHLRLHIPSSMIAFR